MFVTKLIDVFIATSGRTVLFVSHNLAAISSFTNLCCYLQKGQLVTMDQTAKALTAALAMGGDVHVLVAGEDAQAAAETAAKLDGVAKVLLAKNPVALKFTKDAVRRVGEMTYDNAEDFLIRAQEAANSYDNEGRKEGIKQFIDDKTFKPGLGTYDKSKQKG